MNDEWTMNKRTNVWKKVNEQSFAGFCKAINKDETMVKKEEGIRRGVFSLLKGIPNRVASLPLHIFIGSAECMQAMHCWEAWEVAIKAYQPCQHTILFICQHAYNRNPTSKERTKSGVGRGEKILF